MDDRAVSTVSQALAETSWLTVPCPVEYLPALARDILYALEKAGMAVVQLPRPDDGEWHVQDVGNVANFDGSGKAISGVRLTNIGYDLTVHHAEARALAAALLAAAS